MIGEIRESRELTFALKSAGGPPVYLLCLSEVLGLYYLYTPHIDGYIQYATPPLSLLFLYIQYTYSVHIVFL